MILHNLHIIGGKDEKYIRIKDGRLELSSGPAATGDYKKEPHLYFEQAIAFPGLINSHDHLDFNLFPSIGNRLYNNYAEWGSSIHREYKDQIDAVLKVPERLRIQWGIYKNLLTGITTVVNHGKKLPVDNALLTVFQQCQSLHSIRGERFWKIKLNKFYKVNQPAVIHIGEGIDDRTKQEAGQIIKWNLFRRPVIAIHGLAMDDKQAAAFKALIWCPASNHFMFGKTAPIDMLKHKTTILFGTDSALTASWNIWEHLRLAQRESVATNAEIFDMLTCSAAEAWNIKNTGRLATGYDADMVIAKQKDSSDKWNSFYGLDPRDILLVLHKGNIRLFDSELMHQLRQNNIPVTSFSKVYMDGSCKYVQGDFSGLLKEIRNYYSAEELPVTCD